MEIKEFDYYLTQYFNWNETPKMNKQLQIKNWMIYAISSKLISRNVEINPTAPRNVYRIDLGKVIFFIDLI